MSPSPPRRPLPPELDPRGPRRGDVRGATRLAPPAGPTPPGPPAPSRPPQPPLRQPSRPPLRHPHRRRRILGWIAALTSLAVLVAVATGYVAYQHYNGNIARVPVFTTTPNVARPPVARTKAENFLLVGSDTRAGFTPEELKASGTTFDPGARSDTVILAHIPAGSAKAVLVSFPRDSWVQIPAWTDPQRKVHPAHMGKLNSAFAVGELKGGNPQLLTSTIETLTGIRIDHYVGINFVGFQNMVNALGGVDVCLRHDARDHYSGINLSAGTHHISGAVALAFVRQRHNLAGSDLGRIQRQQYFIGAVTRKVLSAGTLLNPFKLGAFLDRATKSITADQGLSFNGLKTLALRLRRLDSKNVQFVTVPFTDDNARRGAQSVVLLDQPKMAALFRALRGERPPAAGPSTGPARVTVAPAAVRVRVYNGTGAAGLATRVAADLTGVGFTVVGKGNRVTGAGAPTVVRYGPSRADSARTLAAAVPGATLAVDPTLGSTVELVVGANYAGARPVTVGGPAPTTGASPSTTASATAGPAVTTAADGATNCAP